ncbi:MAG: hypothetical protein K8R55_01220, partial [Desulfuromonadaceae bacterium]|nr:hypothetical protein [Desulfuromonadaceae bacterium]
MNKHERAKIKATILTQIESLTEDIHPPERAAQTKLRLERLGTALKRIEADNYGECFKCGTPIQMSQLLAFPETMLCLGCLNNP